MQTCGIYCEEGSKAQTFCKGSQFCYRPLRSACKQEFDDKAEEGSLLITLQEYNFFPVLPSFPLLQKCHMIQAASYFHLSETGLLRTLSLMAIMSFHLGKAKKSCFFYVLGTEVLQIIMISL